MSKRIISSPEEMEAFVQIWKYLSANGKLFILVHDSPESTKIYTEEDVEAKTKTIRAFLDSQAIELYIKEAEEKAMHDKSFEGTFKVGITPVKHLQKQLASVYGTEKKDDITVECLLTSYDEMGNMQDVDVIWTQSSN